MISSSGLVPPIVYPQPDPADYAPASGVLTVTTAASSPLAVDVKLAPQLMQTLPDRTVLPLDTIIVPHQARAWYLPAGTPLVQDQWPAPSGQFDRDAWVIDAFGDRSAIAKLLPPTTPTPVYWVLEGVLPASVDDANHQGTGLLDRWLAGDAPGVSPRAQECHDLTDPALQASTPEQTWKAAMLAGTWSELVPAETALGQVAPAPGSGADMSEVLTIWAYAADGTSVPVSGVLAEFGGADPALLAQHPVVTGCQGVTADMPVRFFVRFSTWDVQGSSPDDAKGSPVTLEPDTVDLIDAATGSPVSGSTWTWQGNYGVLQIPRGAIQGATFSLAARFAPGVRILLQRDTQQFYPGTSGNWTWPTAGWTSADGTTPGTWTSFDGIQAGTQTEPVTFWVGTKVRLAWAYQQQPRNWYGQHTGGTLTTRRVAPGHVVHLFRAAGSAIADTFATDQDGEVSGVSFGVQAGDTITAGLIRRLDLPPLHRGNTTVLLAVDDPANSPALFPDGYFHAENARMSVRFPAVTGGVIGATQGPAVIVIDASKKDDRLGNTVHAAAFHALKYARFTNDAVTQLQGDSENLPLLHEFRLRYTSDTVASADTSQSLAGPGTAARSYTRMAAAGSWFTSPIVVHEYGHALVAWLGSVLNDQAHYDAFENAIGAIWNRLESESHYPKGKATHNEGQITNPGVALSEGLALLFECLLGYYGRLGDGKTTGLLKRPKPPPSAGQQGWEQYTYGVWRHDASGDQPSVSLSTDSGRRVEGVFALALFGYITKATGFPGFLVEQGDTRSGSQQPQALLDDWANHQASGKAPLQNLFRWLVTGATAAVHGGSPSSWTGHWATAPNTAATPYPAVYDYLKHLQDTDPNQSGTAESFQNLFDTCLLPWRLEPVASNEPHPPVLAPDPPDPEWK
jgi:hypothetical protein